MIYVCTQFTGNLESHAAASDQMNFLSVLERLNRLFLHSSNMQRSCDWRLCPPLPREPPSDEKPPAPELNAAQWTGVRPGAALCALISRNRTQRFPTVDFCPLPLIGEDKPNGVRATRACFLQSRLKVFQSMSPSSRTAPRSRSVWLIVAASRTAPAAPTPPAAAGHAVRHRSR